MTSRRTNPRSWSGEDADAIQLSLASVVEDAMLMDKEYEKTVSRSTPRTVLVRIPGKPELIFEITVRRMY